MDVYWKEYENQINGIKKGDLVEILDSDNPYHDNGDIEKVWYVNTDTNKITCPDASGGAVKYNPSQVKLIESS